MDKDKKITLIVIGIIVGAVWIYERGLDDLSTTAGALVIFGFALAVISYSGDWIKKKVRSWFKKTQ